MRRWWVWPVLVIYAALVLGSVGLVAWGMVEWRCPMLGR